MTEAQKQALDEIEGQLYAINARNISMRWIGMRKTPTYAEISDLNQMLGFIITEIRTLKETGKLDKNAVHEKLFGLKKLQRLELPIYDGDQVRTMKEKGYSPVMFDLPPTILAIRLTAYLSLMPPTTLKEDVFAFTKTAKKFRIVLEEVPNE